MIHRLAELFHKIRGVFAPSGPHGGPDDLGGAGVRSPLKPRPVLVGGDAKPLPDSSLYHNPVFSMEEERFSPPH